MEADPAVQYNIGCLLPCSKRLSFFQDYEAQFSHPIASRICETKNMLFLLQNLPLLVTQFLLLCAKLHKGTKQQTATSVAGLHMDAKFASSVH